MLLQLNAARDKRPEVKTVMLPIVNDGEDIAKAAAIVHYAVYKKLIK